MAQYCSDSGVDQLLHPDKTWYFCCLWPSIKTDRASNSKSCHLPEDTCPEVFLELPQIPHDKNWKYTLYMWRNYTWCILNTSPVFRTLTLVPDLCCAVFLGYCGAHWGHLVIPWIWSRSSLFCLPIWQRISVLWRTCKQNSTWGRSLQHSWVPLKAGNNVLIQNILHIPSSAFIPWDISPEYFKHQSQGL